MTPGILARRRAEAHGEIVKSAKVLAERFSLDPTALVSAPRDRDTAVAQLFELEAVAAFLTQLATVAMPPVVMSTSTASAANLPGPLTQRVPARGK